MKYLFWRGRSLWCRYQLPGFPEKYALGIYTTGAPSDMRKCEREAEKALASLRTKAVEGTLFDIKPPEEHREYNPKFWRIVGRYWFYNLRFKRSSRNERYHLLASLRRFGKRYAKEITRDDITLWQNEQKIAGAAVNTINNRFTYMKAAFTHATEEQNQKYRLDYNPMQGMTKLSGGAVRSFLLTPEKFERNYVCLKTTSPRFALFYLALSELGRRPLEVSAYTWEMIDQADVEGRMVHFFNVPPEITKTKEFGLAVISERLWQEIRGLGYRKGYVFRNALGAPWRNWEHQMAKLKKVYGEDAGWARDNRRGFVTRKTEFEGMDQYSVMAQTGHKTRAVFDRYRIGQLRNQVNVVMGIIEKEKGQISHNKAV